MKKILLTGSSGFIGYELLKDLSQNFKVYVTLRAKDERIDRLKNVNKIYFKNYDKLNNSLKKIKVDYVVHCATHYVKYHNSKDIKKLSESNILFGNLILENLKKMKVKKFINFSTVWENYDGKKNNFFNLYAAYKMCFKNICKYYQNLNKEIKFYNLIIADTFGKNDKRKKLINLLRINYKKNKLTKILSKKLFINLLNVVDIQKAVRLIIKKNYDSDDYVLKNKNDFQIFKIISKINKFSKKKIKVKWISNVNHKERIYKYKSLKGWKPNRSKIRDIIDLIVQ